VRRYVQGAAGLVFSLTLGTLIVFWAVKETKPSGSAALPILYGVLGACALIWLLAEILRRRERRHELPVPDAHRDELKALAEAYSTTVRYRRPARGKQHPRLERSFWTHFPDAGKLLEKWDAALAKHQGSEGVFQRWLQDHGRGLTAGHAVMPAVESGADFYWSVNSDYLWLEGGNGIAPVTDDTDVDALKRPYEDLLTRARASSEGKALRATLAELLAIEQGALAELQRIQMLHVIRGRCELCR
jgi:hypothetical protein